MRNAEHRGNFIDVMFAFLLKTAENLQNPTLDKITRVMNLVYKHGQRHGLIPRDESANPLRWVWAEFKMPKSKASQAPVPMHPCWPVSCWLGAEGLPMGKTVILFFRVSALKARSRCLLQLWCKNICGPLQSKPGSSETGSACASAFTTFGIH